MKLHIKNVKPTFTGIVTTSEVFNEDYEIGGILVSKKGQMKPWQKVIAVGSMVREINPGDTVMINLENYAVKRYSKDSIQNDIDNNVTLRYQFCKLDVDTEEGKTETCLLLCDRDILYTFEATEETTVVEIPKLIV